MAAEDRDLNRDPITDEPGAHPVGTGVGATGGAVAGAAVGAVGGPIGMAVGGVVGAVVGGLAGRAAAEAVNPTAEEAHWRENYNREPYYEQGRSFDDYGPAYRLGVDGRTRYDDWDSAEPNLQTEWESTRGGSSLSWPQARPASRAAWDRIDTDSSLVSDGNRTTDMGYDADKADATGSTPSTMGGVASTAGMGGQSQGQSGMGDRYADGSNRAGGAAAMVGGAQSTGNTSGDNEDVVDALNDLAECSKDGEYGFRACAEQAERADFKSIFLQRADDCRGAAQELYEQIRQLGGDVDEGGSAAGAMHRGWVSVKAKLSTYDDKAVLEECERGEDNAMARYRKALKQPLPAGVKLIVERQMQGVQRNHDQIKMLRDQIRGQ
ncbi:MAG: PA2169 family four-helix-bundle protein [Ramlibacter sp.]|nr:PA2169 family four-helix-bundle protein [Ramlibacter sp.]